MYRFRIRDWIRIATDNKKDINEKKILVHGFEIRSK